MAKLSDADRLARLFKVLDYLRQVERATVGELAEHVGGSRSSLYEDLLMAWLVEDPENVGIYPFHLHVEYFDPDDPDALPVPRRDVWLDARAERGVPWLASGEANSQKASPASHGPSVP